jgi:hypothetical protein
MMPGFGLDWKEVVVMMWESQGRFARGSSTRLYYKYIPLRTGKFRIGQGIPNVPTEEEAFSQGGT